MEFDQFPSGEFFIEEHLVDFIGAIGFTKELYFFGRGLEFFAEFFGVKAFEDSEEEELNREGFINSWVGDLD